MIGFQLSIGYFQTFIYYSQLTQRKAVSSAIAGHRADAPRCMGTIFWQLNDCWPAPTWSSLDDHNNWKALHYAVKEDYRSIAVLEQIKDDTHYLVLTSELPEDTLVTVQLDFYDLDGQLVNTQRRTYGWDKQPYTDVYQASFNAQGFTFASPELTASINAADHDGPVTFSKDGNTMYFASSSFREKAFEKDKVATQAQAKAES